MFRVESARITAAGVSFQLPTGFVVLEAQEPQVNSTLELRAPDGSYPIISSLDRSVPSRAFNLFPTNKNGCTAVSQYIHFSFRQITCILPAVLPTTALHNPVHSPASTHFPS